VSDFCLHDIKREISWRAKRLSDVLHGIYTYSRSMLQINSRDIPTGPTVTPSHIHVYTSFITSCVLVIIFTLYSTVLFVSRFFILRAKLALISSIGVMSSDYNM